jgi:hypothetical protein
MDLHILKISRLMVLLENSKRDILEDMYFICFSEYPLDDLSIEDLQFNIAKYINDASIEDISKVYKYIYD